MTHRKKTVKKHFVSDLDQLLQEFDKTHPKTRSQEAEIKKYKSIHHLRDIPQEPEPVKPYLWDQEENF